MRYRTYDYKTEIIDTEDHRRVVTDVPGLDPTWYGAYHALWEGTIHVINAYHVPHLDHTPMPLATGPSPTPDTTIKTISSVAVLGPAIYNFQDRGKATCPNGSPGYAIHLWSRTYNPRHQVTDLIIDEASMRFCMMRLALNAPGPLGGNVVWETHFGDVGGYWVQTDGFVEGTSRAFGIKASHGVWRYSFQNMTFPNSLPPQDFETPPAEAAFGPSAYLKAQRLVDIGGRRLNLYCTGSGSPTVVLEAGGGGDMLDWRFVQPLVAKNTRVCSYDRAGFGFSDPGPMPRDAGAIVTDLHALLERAKIAPPYVLVGYSSGELYARVYADRNLNDVAGLVFVEPAFEGDEEQRVDAAAPEIAQLSAAQQKQSLLCAGAAGRGELNPATPMADECTSPPDPDMPDELNALTFAQSLRPGWWNAYVSENMQDSTTQGQVRSEQRSYGNLPMAVVTVENVFPDGLLTPSEQRAVAEIIAEERAPMMALSSKSSSAVLASCTHADVTTQCASKVASAIDAVVSSAR